jgi:tetraacyldisaccharide 4'-kinase
MPDAGRGITAAWYRGDRWLLLLRPLELLFRGLAFFRREAYGAGLFRSYRADRPVVIVGNITVGGTGKTPVVIALVEALQSKGLRPGVVSRGYGARAPHDTFPHIVTAASTARQCGDEPLLIQRRTGAPVVVAPKRPAAVRALLKSAAVDIVLCDDGLQHYPLARDMEIVIVDAQQGLGNGYCLPAGPLREPSSRLASVDRVLYRNGDGVDAVRYQPVAWVNVDSGEQRELDSFSGREGLVAVAGIGQPAQFFASLESMGMAARCKAFPDHHAFTASDFEPYAGATILMTEKDAVKCREIAGPDAWYLRVDALVPTSLVDAVAALARPAP